MPCVCLGLSLPCDLSSLTDGRGAVDLQAPLPRSSLFLVRMGVTTSKFSMVRLETGSPHLFYIIRVFFWGGVHFCMKIKIPVLEFNM